MASAGLLFPSQPLFFKNATIITKGIWFVNIYFFSVDTLRFQHFHHLLAPCALGNPWIFNEITCVLEGRDFSPPTVKDRIAVALQHTERLIALYGEKNGTAQARKHIAWYIKGIYGASSIRNRVMTCSTYAEIQELLLTLI